jgi:hypothetical protein
MGVASTACGDISLKTSLSSLLRFEINPQIIFFFKYENAKVKKIGFGIPTPLLNS